MIRPDTDSSAIQRYRRIKEQTGINQARNYQEQNADDHHNDVKNETLFLNGLWNHMFDKYNDDIYQCPRSYIPR